MPLHPNTPRGKTMSYDTYKHHRRSIRLKGYDYTQTGAYFVTICIKHGQCALGEIIDGEMVLNNWGRIRLASINDSINVS